MRWTPLDVVVLAVLVLIFAAIGYFGGTAELVLIHETVLNEQ